MVRSSKKALSTRVFFIKKYFTISTEFKNIIRWFGLFAT
jgi:hypothetical protein